MGEFERLQALWQSQEAASGPSVADLMRGVRRHSRKHLGIYAVKTVLVLALTVVMVAAVRESALAMAGVILVVAGAAVTIGIDWMAHVTLARLEFTAPASGFARAAIQKLRRLERPRGVQYAALLLGPVAGLNLMELALLHDLAWEWRVSAHLGLSLAVLAGAWGGLRVRSRRFERETRPLIERLEAFEEERFPAL